MKINKSLIFLLSILILMGGNINAASAQGDIPTEDEVNQIARQLYCPVCENIPLDTCGTEACEQWRGVIRDKLAAGWSEGQIKTYFVEQYGDRVLAEPPRRGFNWLVYVLPPLAFVIGLTALFLGYQQWRTEGDPDIVQDDNQKTPVEQEIPEEYLKRVEDELAKRE
jgi:cytochrome c-type biogenesis protein CcmH